MIWTGGTELKLLIKVGGENLEAVVLGLQTYDGTEITLVEKDDYLELTVHTGGVFRHKQSRYLAIAHVSPWFSDATEELL